MARQSFFVQRQLGHQVFIGRSINRIARDLRTDVNNGALLVMSDRETWRIWGDQLEVVLCTDELAHRRPLLTPNRTKDMSLVQWCLAELYRRGFQRRDTLVIVGGGNAIDSGGLVASLFMRGIPYINVPTTLVAQIDASIGGKTGVNFMGSKNLLGSFYYPQSVLIYTEFLSTLNSRQFQHGLAEAIKVAVIDSPALFRLLERHGNAIVHRPQLLTRLVRLAVDAKLRLLRGDPLEDHLSRSLNLGHTVAHVLEGLTSFRISHGDAVAVGIAAAVRVGMLCGLTSPPDGERILKVIEKCGLPTFWQGDLEGLHPQLESIRRIRDGSLRYVVPKQIGSVSFLDTVDPMMLRSAITGLAQ